MITGVSVKEVKVKLFICLALLLAATPVFSAGDLMVTGKIGAGTTAPRAELDVNGTAIIPYTVSTGYVDLAKGATPVITGGTLLSGGPCYRGDGSRWEIQNFPASMVLDLGASAATCSIKYITFGTHWKESTNAPSEYLLERSDDGNNWNVVVSVTASTAKHIVTPVDLTGVRYIRLTVNAPQQGQTEVDVAGLQVLSDAYGELARLQPWTVNGDDAFLAVSGNLGVGTADAQGYKLYVAGTAYSTGGWQGSDARFKEEIKPVADPLAKVLQLNGVSYKWKTVRFKEKGFPEGRHFGVIAQDIEKVVPEVVKTAPDGMKSVAYTELIPILIEAIKAQQAQIEQLKSKLAEMPK